MIPCLQTAFLSSIMILSLESWPFRVVIVTALSSLSRSLHGFRSALVVVNDSEAGPHNSLQWIIGVLFAEVGVVLGVDVLVDGGVLELRHHSQVFQTAILLAADGLVQLLHGE
jgi:hypothetical protein